MPRFVLLRHECPPDYRDGPHWDLMLERPDMQAEHRLATWSLLALPTAWVAMLGREGASQGGSRRASRAETVDATRLADHRAVYLDREGPIGGGRGSVERWARGSVAWLGEGVDLVELRLVFEGINRAGTVCLSTPGGERWRLEWVEDPH
ncbi:MAG: hypothetical protein AAFV43_05115 [Planctomycetota bacterium]